MSDLNTAETVFKASSGDVPDKRTAGTVFATPSSEPENKRTAGTVFMTRTEDAGDKRTAGTVRKSGEAANQGYTDSAPQSSAVQGERLAEGSVINGYKINSVLSEGGCEAVVYLVMKNGVQYALKLYNRAFEFSETKMETLRSTDCIYVAHLEDYGYYRSMPYEVYPYYKNGTIEKLGKVEGTRLTEYVNQLNEALHCLHNIDRVTEMIHGDIKPSNIFLSDDGTYLIIGDFGISSVKSSGADVFGEICGTPEFAPPSTGVVGTMSKTRAYDYGSLGMVVLYLATGRSYFSGCSAEDISAGWKKGIDVPDFIQTTVKRLLEGLLVFDEAKRFGYDEVRAWYEGSFVQVAEQKDIYAKDNSKKRALLWVGMVDNRIIEVSSVAEWVLCMKENWELAKLRLGDRNIERFLRCFYPDGREVNKIRTLADGIDKDAAVFKIIYTLSDIADFVYKGRNYCDVANFIKAVYEGDEIAKEAVEKGLLMFYLVRMGYSEEVIRALEEIMNLKNCADDFKTKIISYTFSKEKLFNGWSSVEELRQAVCKMQLDEIEALTKNNEFLAWIYVMGLKDTALSIIRSGG